MSDIIPFVGFPKIARLRRDIIISEKIDGSNAQVFIENDGVTVHFGSRNRWLRADSDNYGFCAWGIAHTYELLTLGPGHHFGEWWGKGINRGYGLTEKRFSLFNTYRWTSAEGLITPPPADRPVRPACCHVVPVLYHGPFDLGEVDTALAALNYFGSYAAKGFMSPEGVVIYHEASKTYFKQTIRGDEGKHE